MITYDTISAFVAMGCMLVAAVAAMVGWVLPIPDGSRRFTARFMAWGSTSIAFLLWTGHDGRHHRWAWFAVGMISWVYAAGRAAHWWNELEKARARARFNATVATITEAFRVSADGGSSADVTALIEQARREQQLSRPKGSKA